MVRKLPTLKPGTTYEQSGSTFIIAQDGSPHLVAGAADKPSQHAPGWKDTNPKDAVGIKKWRVYSTVPMTVIWELGVAMLEGARKYGRHNYRVSGVRASVYVDAAKGHIDTWWEGEDIDADSKLNHITKAIASLTVLRDAMIQKKFVDDRPPRTNMDEFRAQLQPIVDAIFERHPNAVPAYLEGDQYPVAVGHDRNHNGERVGNA